MGQDTEQLTTHPADIEVTRADLTRDIDELSEKSARSEWSNDARRLLEEGSVRSARG